MLLEKLKKTILIICLGIGFIFAQEDSQVDEFILGEFDLIAKMAGDDIRDAIYTGVIPAEIAITSFAVYGATPMEKKYFEEVMNRIFYSDVSFKLITIPESRAIQVEEVGDKLIIKKGASKNRDLERYAESINSKHYGEIYIYMLSDRIYMKFLVHDAGTGDVVWSRDWSVKGDDRITVEVGYMFGYPLLSVNTFHYFHLFFGARATGLGEFGVSLDLGGFHNKALLSANQGEEPTSELGDIGASIIIAPKVSLNILELAGVNYDGMDFYVVFKPGMYVDAVLFTDASGSGRGLYQPQFNFSANTGLGFGFRNVNLDILFDVNPKNVFLLSVAIYRKF